MASELGRANVVGVEDPNGVRERVQRTPLGVQILAASGKGNGFV